MAHPLAEVQDYYEGFPSFTTEERRRIQRFTLPGDYRYCRDDYRLFADPKIRKWYREHEEKLRSLERLAGGCCDYGRG